MITETSAITINEATAALTMIDVGIKTLGLKILDWPGGFTAIESLCRKLEAIQQTEKV
jgi:hypothetical protein